MLFKTISTGSQGNGYLLNESSGKSLLLEAGVHLKKVKQASGFNLHSIVGCLVTHEHNDHAKFMPEYMNSGIDVYATKGTFEATGTLHHHRANVIAPNSKIMIRDYAILPFDVRHDAAEPVGFLINHSECGNTLFMTDTFYCPYTFRNLNNIIIEANYDDDIINEKLQDKKFLRDRVKKSHMSLKNCISFLKANDLSKVNNIVVIHLSESNSNEIQFRKAVEGATGKSVTIAKNDQEVWLGRAPF